MPALTVRYLSKLEFSVWTLVLQVIVYVHVFGFGLQTVITYYIARLNAQGSVEAQRTTVRAALTLAACFTAAASFVVVVLVALYPYLFSTVPAELTTEFRIAIAVLGFSAAFQLMALVPAGVFFGLHRNIIPVASQVLVRALCLVSLWCAIQLEAGLLTLSITLAVCGALLVPANFLAACKWAGTMFRPLAAGDRSTVKDLFHHCSGLAVWNVTMLLVNGMDVLLVGYFDFGRVAAFSLAATAITIFVGVIQALLNPLVALGSSLHAQPDQAGSLQALLIRASRYCSAFLILVLVGFVLVGGPVLELWTGPAYVGEVAPFLMVLLLAQAVRNLMAPYAVLLISVGMQRKALLPAMVEGVVNLGTSIVLAQQMGAMGVAYGTLIGAVAGVAGTLLLVVGKTGNLVSSTRIFVQKAIALPMCGITFILLYSLYGTQ
ncbi:hypothetical protein [Massilia sp. SYSU DXS3249]